MNICLLKESLHIGGTERSTANISKVLDCDHKVWIALFDGSEIAYSTKGKLVNFNLPPKKTLIGKIYNTIIRDFKLRRMIRREHIDVLYTLTGVANRMTHYKYRPIKIISARDFGGMLERSGEYKAALDKADAMICNSEYTKDFYKSKHPEDASKVFTLYNFINTDEICEQATEEVEREYKKFIGDHQGLIVSAGRFCKEKGYEYLIEAFVKARESNGNFGLVLVGDGELKQKYLDIISKYQIVDHVYFTGFQTNPYKYMVRCNIFVLSSISEGFPNVLVEAMSLGLPVIADNCFSGPAEIIREDRDYDAVNDEFVECDYGVLTPRITEDNEQAVLQLAKAIVWLTNSLDLMRYYGKMSKLRAELFSFSMARRNINAIIDDLVGRRPG